MKKPRRNTNSEDKCTADICRIAPLTFIIIAFLLCSGNTYGQTLRSLFRTKVLYDTLVATNKKDFMYNNVTITNLTTDKISVLVNIEAPEGWQIVTQKILTVSLNANENTIIPIRLLPAGSNTSNWEKVSISYRLNNSVDTIRDQFAVRVQPYTRFKAILPQPSVVLSEYQRTIAIPITVKNRGNRRTAYNIHVANSFFRLDEHISFQLDADKDTLVQADFRLTESMWALMKKEEVKVIVRADSGETVNLLQYVSKIGYSLKEHSSAFLDMPLQLETGATYQGDASIQYYGGMHGRVDFSETDRAAFDLRSNTYANGQVINNHIVRAEYEGKHLRVSAGNIMELTDFVLDGYGLKTGYEWNKGVNKVYAFGMLQSRTGDSKLAGAYAEWALKPNVILSENVTTNFDYGRNLNSFLFKQGADIKIGQKMALAIDAGAGMEHNTSPNFKGDNEKQFGYSLGYNFQWNTKLLNVLSSVIYNSNAYPGVFKGQRAHTHDVRLNYKSVFVGGYYDFNFRKQNIYSDTVLFSNVFNLQSENFGARTGVRFRRSNITLSSGIQNQTQIADTTGANSVYTFRYLNMNTTIWLGEHLYFTTNSYAGYGAMKDEADSDVFVTSNQGGLQYKFAGISFRYDNGPYYYHEYISYRQNPTEYERLIISPNVEISLFKKKLTVRAQYNYTSNKPGDFESNNILGNIIYMNPAKGFDLNVSGILPVNDAQNKPFVSASLRVRLHVPFIAVRKYYNVKLVLFQDVNGDGERDNDEPPVSGQTISLGDNMFISDNNGMVMYRNVEKGNYSADYGFTSKVKGWVPSMGTIQSYSVNSNRTIYVPYKKSKVLYGQLKLDADDNSNLTFSLQNIKVVVTSADTSATYSTLTDAKGEFYFNLPAGNYIVTLSPAAFDDVFKPSEFSQTADLMINDEKTVYFTIKQKRRRINIKKK